MSLRPRNLRLALGFLAACVMPAAMSVQAQSQPPQVRLDEARAAYQLGFPTDANLPARTSLRSAQSLVEELRGESGLPVSVYLSAVRLAVIISGETQGETAVSALIASLPASVSGVTPAAWSAQRQLWNGLETVRRRDWDTTAEILGQIPADTRLTDEAQADLELLRAKLALRRSGNRESHFSALARLIAEAPARSIDLSSVQEFGSDEFGAIDAWTDLKEVLRQLESAGPNSQVARRLWLELAAPSIDPRFNHFPPAAPEELAALNARFKAHAAAWLPPSDQRASAVGGWRELRAHELRIQDYYRARRFDDLLSYLAALPADVAGVPSSLFAAYRTAWQTLALGGKLRLAEVADNGPNIEAALALLPMPQNAEPLSFLGAARVRLKKDGGPNTLARYFTSGKSADRANRMMLRMITTETMLDLPANELRACLATLRTNPADPLALATRSNLIVHHFEKLPENERLGVVEEAIADGARALRQAEIDEDLRQEATRRELTSVLAEAVGTVSGTEARQRFLEAATLPVSENPELVDFLPPELVDSTAAPRRLAGRGLNDAGNPASFESIAAEIGEDIETIPVQYLDELADTDLAGAVRTLPTIWDSRRDLVVGKWVLQEAYERGATPLSLTAIEWETLELRLGELFLGKADTAALGETMLGDLTTTASLTAAADRILDGVSAMSTLDVYLWGIDWMQRIDGEHMENETDHLQALLGPPFYAAYGRTDIQTYLADLNLSVETRHMHRYLIARALAHAGQFAEAKDVLEDTIESTELAADSEIKFTAEHWRLYAWTEEARVSENEQTKAALLQQVVDEVRDRLPSLEADDRKRKFAYRGRWAALQLNDSTAQQEFETIIAQIEGE